MIPCVSNWFSLEEKKPDIGDVIIACVNNSESKMKGLPTFPVIPVIFNEKFFLPIMDSAYRISLHNIDHWKPLKDIIAWQPIPSSPREFRDIDESKKGKCYLRGKFFNTHEEMFEYAKKWMDLPLDYDNFCNDVRIMMSSVLLNFDLRKGNFTNKDAYEHARLYMAYWKDCE